MKETMCTISKIYKGSIAEEMGIEEGDILLAINGKPVVDIMDYLFFMSDDYLTLEIEKKNKEIWDLEVDKEYDEDLGLEFENPILDDAKSCQNKCIFCFIDQMPKGMRETLYFKDDDSRLSFLQGNFVTLTNMKKNDFDRMIEYRISPVNVSIHTTNPELRVKMLGNRFAGDIMEKLSILTDAGIEVNGQVVLCRHYNDKEELDRTIQDLRSMKNRIGSMAVVPFGATKYREGLTFVELFDRSSANEVIDQVEAWQTLLLKEIGSRFVFLSDEFYIMADREMPKYEAYEGFIQIENGVGLIRKFEYEIMKSLSRIKSDMIFNKKIRFITGTSAAAFMEQVAKLICNRCPSLDVDVISVKNEFFGEHVTVAGLLTGQDIIARLDQENVGEDHVLMFPETMFRDSEEIFLDDILLSELGERFKAKCLISPVDGKKFIDLILKLAVKGEKNGKANRSGRR